jgi:hypothetical protein
VIQVDLNKRAICSVDFLGLSSAKNMRQNCAFHASTVYSHGPSLEKQQHSTYALTS